MKANQLVGCAYFTAVSVALAGCGSDAEGDGNSANPPAEAKFVPAAAPPNGCALLSRDDVKTLVADPIGGDGVSEPEFYAHAWQSGCGWQGGGGYVTLWVAGALDEAAEEMLNAGTYGGGERELVSGLGDEAQYFENMVNGEQGVTAKSGSFVAAVTTEHVTPSPSRDAYVPLVRKVLTELR